MNEECNKIFLRDFDNENKNKRMIMNEFESELGDNKKSRRQCK